MQVVYDIFDAQGRKRLDLTRRLPKYLGTYTISTTMGMSGVITHPAFGAGKPFCMPRSWIGNQPGSVPQITLLADRITWRYPDNGVAFIDVIVALGVL